eukprot:828986-Amphidinium_carterae.1
MELCYHIYGASLSHGCCKEVLTHAPFLAWMKDYGECIKELGNTLYKRGVISCSDEVPVVLALPNVLGSTTGVALDCRAAAFIPRRSERGHLHSLGGQVAPVSSPAFVRVTAGRTSMIPFL